MRRPICFGTALNGRHLQPLCTKMQLLQQGPLLAKGDTAADVYNNKGTPSKIQCYRTVLVGPNISKHHYAFIRARLKDAIMAVYKTPWLRE